MPKGHQFHWYLREHKTEDEKRDGSGSKFEHKVDLAKVGEEKVGMEMLRDLKPYCRACLVARQKGKHNLHLH